MALCLMAIYTLVRQYSPSIVPAFWQAGFLFNDLAHVRQQSQQPFCTISALNQTTQLAEARCTFFVGSAEAVSPIAAPFGSIEFAQTLPDTILNDLITALIEESRQTGARTLRLVNYPRCYASRQTDRLTQLLSKQGFCLTVSNSTFYLPITDKPFADGLTTPERRRLEKCQRAHFQFIHWPNPDVDAVIAFLTDIYQQRDYELTLSPVRLASLLRQFADAFSVFVVQDDDTIAALTVTVRVRDDILYNFLPASRPDYHQFSPMVMLTEGLFNYCQQQAIRLLDLGLSLDGNRQPKLCLMRFKRNLGALESPKPIFEKRL